MKKDLKKDFLNRHISKYVNQLSEDDAKQMLSEIKYLYDNILTKFDNFDKVKAGLLAFANSINDKEIIGKIEEINNKPLKPFTKEHMIKMIDDEEEILNKLIIKRQKYFNNNKECQKIAEKIKSLNKYQKETGNIGILNDLKQIEILMKPENLTDIETFIKDSTKIINKANRKKKQYTTNNIKKPYNSIVGNGPIANITDLISNNLKIEQNLEDFSICSEEIEEGIFKLKAIGTASPNLTRELHQIYNIVRNIHNINKNNKDRRFEKYYEGGINKDYVVIDDHELITKYLGRSEKNYSRDSKVIARLIDKLRLYTVIFKPKKIGISEIESPLINVLPFKPIIGKYPMYAIGLTPYSKLESDNLNNNYLPEAITKLEFEKRLDFIYFAGFYLTKMHGKQTKKIEYPEPKDLCYCESGKKYNECCMKYDLTPEEKINKTDKKEGKFAFYHKSIYDFLLEVKGGKEIIDKLKNVPQNIKSREFTRKLYNPLKKLFEMYIKSGIILNYKITDLKKYNEDDFIKKKFTVKYNYFKKFEAKIIDIEDRKNDKEV